MEDEIKKDDIKKDDAKVDDVKKDVIVDTQKEDVKINKVKKDEPMMEVKKDTSEYDAMVERVRLLEESNKRQSELLNSEMIKNTIMEKVQDKGLQKAIMDTGLVKSISDIDSVMKMLDVSNALNTTTSHKDGFIPRDEVQADAYKQATKDGNILEMIKHKMSRNK